MSTALRPLTCPTAHFFPRGSPGAVPSPGAGAVASPRRPMVKSQYFGLPERLSLLRPQWVCQALCPLLCWAPETCLQAVGLGGCRLASFISQWSAFLLPVVLCLKPPFHIFCPGGGGDGGGVWIQLLLLQHGWRQWSLFPFSHFNTWLHWDWQYSTRVSGDSGHLCLALTPKGKLPFCPELCCFLFFS